MRNPALIAGLAVPLVLGLAAWGLDLLARLHWPQFDLVVTDGARNRSATRFSLLWVVLLPPLLWSISAAYEFGHGWLKAGPMPDNELQVLEALQTDSTQWVATPFGEHYWLPYALQTGLKVNSLIRPWRWRDRPLPEAYLQASRGVPDSVPPHSVRSVAGLYVAENPASEYACVETGQGCVPCRARARGGHIDVECMSDAPGVLVVRENQWSGWQARRDGVPVEIMVGSYLAVEAPSGSHQYAFRYSPWDAYAGLGITLIGALLACWLYFRRPATSYL